MIKTNILKLLSIFTCFTFIIAFNCDIAFASSIWVGDEFDLSEYGQKIETGYHVATAVMCPCAVIGICINAYKVLFCAEEVAAKSKKWIFIILVVIALILIIPSVVSLGIDIGQKYGWKPPTV